jgi:hypothetical protein
MIEDKILDGILLLDQKRCPECNISLNFWSMPDYDDDLNLQGRIRRWWHFEHNKESNCPRMWDHAN